MPPSLARDSDTATWQLSCLPNWPQYWRATPTEWVPFLGKPVSSRIQAVIGPCRVRAGSTCSHTAVSTAVSSHGALATKWCRDWWVAWTCCGSRHRLDALALAGQQQAGAIAAQRIDPVGVTDLFGKSAYVSLEPNFISDIRRNRRRLNHAILYGHHLGSYNRFYDTVRVVGDA